MLLSTSAKAVPSTTLCVVLLRQPLCNSLQHWEIHAFPKTGFNCSQNPLIGFFKVNFFKRGFRTTSEASLQVSSLLRDIYHLSYFSYFRLPVYRRIFLRLQPIQPIGPLILIEALVFKKTFFFLYKQYHFRILLQFILTLNLY